MPEYPFIELINPEIIDRQGSVTIYEGCLSFPGRNGAIERPEQVTVKALDRTEAQMCILSSSCNEPAYVKLITALCKEHGISMLKVS